MVGPLKRAVAAAVRTIAPTVLARRAATGLAVFTFHDVGDSPSPFQARHGMCTPVTTFRRQVDWIASRFDVVGADALLGDARVGEGTALITFDDGWAGIFDHALPHLASRGLDAIVFLNGAPIAGEADLTAYAALSGVDGWPTPSNLPVATIPRVHDRPDVVAHQGRYATEDTVRAAASPLVRYGSHLHRHWVVSSLDDGQLSAEVSANASWLAGIPGSVPLFAFPFGKPGAHYTGEQVRRVLDLGYERVFSSVPVVNALPLGRHLHRVSLVPDHRTANQLWWATYQLGLRPGARTRALSG